MARGALTNRSKVKHVLVSWADPAKNNGGQVDPRAQKRTAKDAETLALQLLERARAGEDFDALMAEYSEDPGSAHTGIAYEATPSAQLVFEFKRMSLRLKIGEVGMVKSTFGWHVIKRIE